jgi:hypothetical protein
LLEVELVQLEQAALLRCLARRHGLRRVLIEGLTPDGVEALRARVEAARGMLARRPELLHQQEDVRGLLARLEAEGKGDADRHARAAAVEKEIAALLAQPERELLELGAPARLLAGGELAEVLPLDDTRLLAEARPVGADGKVRADAAKGEAREAAIVAALRHGPIAVIVLGGGHDLSAQVRRLGGGRCDSLRVTTARYREAAGEDDRHDP